MNPAVFPDRTNKTQEGRDVFPILEVNGGFFLLLKFYCAVTYQLNVFWLPISAVKLHPAKQLWHLLILYKVGGG